jgi:FkbM family methyltransferase
MLKSNLEKICVFYRPYKRKLRSEVLSHFGIYPRHNLQMNINIEEHGTIYGRYCIYPEKINKNSIIYSFGIGRDISFELSIINKYGVSIFAFDPTPKAIEWLRNQTVPENFIYSDCGLADFNGTADLYYPKNSKDVSASIFPKGTSPFKAKMKRLTTIMAELDHRRIDVLKMDIEGAEYSVLNDIKDLDIGQILLEFHHDLMGKRATEMAISRLNQAGYRIFWISGCKSVYSFIKNKE